ncbi:centrosomal protein 20 [Anolis sagrei]|uniref:centrosomal protein 20 n=1 Tax=Anolis sagrei TaxID=38937 RepID=UPI0035225DA7
MATITELKAALKDALEKRGALGAVKARLRAEVFSALDDQTLDRPTLTRENLLINELIREYLEFNQYRYAASVLIAESGQPEVPLDREFLVKELNIVEDPSSRAVPLLYGIITRLLQSNEEKDTFPKASTSQFSKWNLSKPMGSVLGAEHPGAGLRVRDPLPKDLKRGNQQEQL